MSFESILGSASRDIGAALRLFALALLGALLACDSAWCAEEGVERARAAYSAGDYATAKDLYTRAIHAAEARHGPTDIAIVEPLVGLADTLTASGQPSAAIEPLTRAVAIVRRAAGLYDERQYALLSQLTDLHSLTGDVAAAATALLNMERVSERAYGRESLQHALSLARIAAWQCRLGRFDSGRERFRRSIARLRAPTHEEQLIDALLGLARCSFDELAAEGIATSAGSLDTYRGPVMRTNRMSAGSPAFQLRVTKILRVDGEQALRRAAQLAETAPLPPERRVAVLLQVGDWFQAKDHSRTARKYYASAQRWLRRTTSLDDPLAVPVQVLYPVPPMALRNQLARETRAAEHYVEIEFTVRADGQVDSERVIIREPGKSAADETLLALKAARFRPRMVGGTPLGTQGVRFRQDFR
jgi:tetratricopeptide (TPR) repeat protein